MGYLPDQFCNWQLGFTPIAFVSQTEKRSEIVSGKMRELMFYTSARLKTDEYPFK